MHMSGIVKRSGKSSQVTSSTALFHSRENVGVARELYTETNKETRAACVKDSLFKSAQQRAGKVKTIGII